MSSTAVDWLDIAARALRKLRRDESNFFSNFRKTEKLRREVERTASLLQGGRSRNGNSQGSYNTELGSGGAGASLPDRTLCPFERPAIDKQQTHP